MSAEILSKVNEGRIKRPAKVMHKTEAWLFDKYELELKYFYKNVTLNKLYSIV